MKTLTVIAFMVLISPQFTDSSGMRILWNGVLRPDIDRMIRILQQEDPDFHAEPPMEIHLEFKK